MRSFLSSGIELIDKSCGDRRVFVPLFFFVIAGFEVDGRYGSLFHRFDIFLCTVWVLARAGSLEGLFVWFILIFVFCNSLVSFLVLVAVFRFFSFSGSGSCFCFVVRLVGF